MSTPFESVALTAEHDTEVFDCGVTSLNTWLTEQAWRAQQAGTARTFVWTAADPPERVWAYYSLAPTEVVRAELSRSLSSGYSVIPGFLLARLAVDTALHGFGRGSQLLVDALTRAVHAADTGGGRLVVVDALDDAAANFYRHHEFTPVKGDPHRLVLRLADVRKLLT